MFHRSRLQPGGHAAGWTLLPLMLCLSPAVYGVEFKIDPKFTVSNEDLAEVVHTMVLPDGRFRAPSAAGIHNITGPVPAGFLTRKPGELANRFQVFQAFGNAMEPALRNQGDADSTGLCTLMEGAVFDFSDLVYDVSTGRILGTFTEQTELKGSARFYWAEHESYFDCLEQSPPTIESEIKSLDPGPGEFIGGNGLAPAADRLWAAAYDADRYQLKVYSNANPYGDDWRFEFAWQFQGFEIGNSVFNRPTSSFTSGRSWNGDWIGGLFSTLFADENNRISLYMWWHHPADGQFGIRKVDEVTAAEFPSEEVDFIFQGTDCLGTAGILYCLHWNDLDQEWRVSAWPIASGPDVPISQLGIPIPKDRQWAFLSHLELASYGRNLVAMSSSPDGNVIWSNDGIALAYFPALGANPRAKNPYAEPLELYDLDAIEEIEVYTGSAEPEFHGAQGMLANVVSSATGEFSVAWSGSVQQSNVALELPFKVGPGVSGSWFDPDHNGEGFVIEVLSATAALVFWFSYTPEGEQAWFIGVGAIVGDSIVVEDMRIANGATFGPDFDPQTVQREPWGVLTLAFDDCNNGLASYTSRPGFGTGLQRIKRLTAIAGADCAEPEAHPQAVAAAEIVLDGSYSGAWFDRAHDGEGFAIEIINATTAVIYWFTYTPDGDGKQAWFIGVGHIEGDTIVVEPALITAGGEFGPGFDPAKVVRSDWGTITFTFSDCNTGEMTYESGVAGFGAGQQQLTRLTTLDGLACG